jgi:tetratricopeptide (TPR) repeat protein
MKVKNYTLLIILILFLFYLSSFSYAWKINKELEQEINVKKAAVAVNPMDPYSHFDLAITYAYTNHIQEGWDELKKVHEVDPKFRKAALPMFIQKVTANPQDWKLRFRMAFVYYFNNHKQDAIRELKNVLIIDNNNVWAYGYISLIYGEIGDIDTAMDFARKGLKIDNQVAALHLLLGEGYYKKNDPLQGFLERVEALRLRALGY